MSSSEQRRAKWRQLFAEQQASGHSVTVWCSRHGIAPPTFYYWRKQVSDPVPSPISTQWLALAPPAVPDPLRLGAGGHRSGDRLRSPHLLHDVLSVLGAR